MRLSGDRSAFDPIIESFSPGEGIPNRIEREYNEMLKKTASKLWSGTLKAAASGFGKGLLLTGALVLAGFAIASGIGAVAAGASFASGITPGLITAGNFMFGSLTGPAILAAGGALGAVSDVRKHTNHLTAEMARVEAEGYAIAREANLIKEIGQVQAAQEQPAQPLQNTGMEKECSHCAREIARRESAQQLNSVTR